MSYSLWGPITQNRYHIMQVPQPDLLYINVSHHSYYLAKLLSRGKTMSNEQILARKIVQTIKALSAGRKLRFMEVCGTHTVSIFRAGIRGMLSPEIELVSGPGCPVCVTPDGYVDAAVFYAGRPDMIIATFGDMLKVPGSRSTLAEAKARGADVRVVYSPLDSLRIAAENPDKQVVFLAVGFETTAPTAAAAIIESGRRRLGNFFVLSAQKLVPSAIKALLDDTTSNIDGFILPGHVAVVTGARAFCFLAEKYRMPGVVAGFSAMDILRAVYRLTVQASSGKAAVENAYEKVVRADGNPAALEMMMKVYEPCESEWRGIGTIPNSGLKLRDEYEKFDITKIYPVEIGNVTTAKNKSLCKCGEVLKGKITPPGCPLFGKACTPTRAAGPCMVSVEGACAAWYKYGGAIFNDASILL